MARAVAPEPEAEDSAEVTAEDTSEVTEHPVCPVAWCPICLAVSVAQPLQPELVTHLLRAGNELLLALRAVVDARARDVAPDDDAPSGPTRLEKIDLG